MLLRPKLSPRSILRLFMPSLFSSMVVHLGDSSYSSGEALDITACGRIVGRHFISRKRAGVTCSHCLKTKAYQDMGVES